MTRGAGRSSHSERGTAAVEFALVSIVMLVFVLGVVSMAFLFQAQISVTHAAREGARLAAVDKFDLAVVRAHSGVPHPTLLTATLTSGEDDGGTWVEVHVTYPVTLGFFPQYGANHSVSALSRTIDVEGVARMRAEF